MNVRSLLDPWRLVFPREHHVDRDVGGAERGLDQFRGRRERLADVVEAVCPGVFGQHRRHFRPHVKQVADRVLVFPSIQPAADHLALRAVGGGQRRAERGEERLLGAPVRLLLGRRRHLAVGDAIVHAHPTAQRLGVGQVLAEGGEIEPADPGRGIVTIGAVSLDEHPLRCGPFGGPTSGAAHEGGRAETSDQDREDRLHWPLTRRDSAFRSTTRKRAKTPREIGASPAACFAGL